MSESDANQPKDVTWSEDVKEARRALLLDAAASVFADKGLTGASMRAIASRAGCTTGAIYPIFKSKEAIYAALLERSLRALDEAVHQAIRSSDTHEQEIRRGCEAFLNYYLANPFEVNLGLYAFHGISRKGTGHVSDESLNAALLTVVHRLEDSLSAYTGRSKSKTRVDIAVIFTQLIGALVLDLSGRTRMLDTDPHQTIDRLLSYML